MKALLVENSKLFQGLISQVLAESGLDVTCADDTNKGLDCLSCDDYGLIAVSYDVDDAENFDLIKKIKSEKNLHNIPTLLLTDTDDVNVRKTGLENGYTDVICKQHIDALQQYVRDFSESTSIRYKGQVLYIEDDFYAADLVRLYLNDIGLVVDHYINAEEALVALDEKEYDLVISDVVLPGKLSGFGVIEHVRHLDNENANIPILAVSAFSDSARKVELLRHGANDFVEKPFQVVEFVVRVTNLIKNKQLIDQVKRNQSRLYKLAMTDQLTGLYNRYSMLDLAPKWISDAYRHETDLCLLMIDMDNFKQINDCYGHAAGDKVLKEFGHVLSDAVRDGDIVARFGGEEFVVLLKHCDIADGLAKAEQIRKLIVELKPMNLPISVSIGMASLSKENEQTFEGLLKQADDAMYEAKNKGRNKVILFGSEATQSEAMPSSG